jgi:hypothetical protein
MTIEFFGGNPNIMDCHMRGHFREMFMSKTLTGSGSITMKNLNGTSDKDCSCGSWLGHWKKFSKTSTTPKCHVQGCESQAEVGAHVILPNMKDESLRKLNFIAPMCKHTMERRVASTNPSPTAFSSAQIRR